MTIRICVSILPKTIAETLNLIEKAEDCRADFIEVRLDLIKDYKGLADVANHGKAPMIATNRPFSCQGKFSGSEIERQQILLKAARNGFEYVDVELSTPKLEALLKDLRQLGVKAIVSSHDFNRPLGLSEMYTILAKEIAKEADVCKIVTTAKTVKDNLTVLNFASDASRDAKIVCFCLGELGKLSRILSPVFGGFFTIACLRRGSETASGQMSIQEMRDAYRVLRLA